MRIEDIKCGIIVLVSSIIEEEIDGVKRRKGALGQVEAPVFGTGGMWWWVTHADGCQVKYRYCEISEMKTKRIEKNEAVEGSEENSENMQDTFRETFLFDYDAKQVI